MMRNIWMLMAVLLTACGTAPESAAFSLPEVIGADWKLASTEQLPAESVPTDISKLGLRSAQRGRYQGLTDLTITVYGMTSGSGAFELAQRWRAAEGRLAFYVDSLFIVLESEAMDHAALAQVANSLEKNLKSGGLSAGPRSRSITLTLTHALA